MDSQFVICIWVDGDLEVMRPILRACLNETPFAIIITGNFITQNSKPASNVNVHANTFEAEGLFLDPKLSVLSQSHKISRGSSLELAFREASQKGFSHAITIENQGQYFVSALPRLIAEASQYPASLIIANRMALLSAKPDFLTRYQPLGFIPDPNCRVRIYPLEPLMKMKFFFAPYAFESEALLRLYARGILVRNVEISNKALAEEEKEKRFSKWREKYQAGFLRTVLIVISLLREKTEPFKSSLSLAIGVFVGTLPIFGLHTVIVAGLAFLFPLSFVYLWLGTHVSLPPFVPILLLLSHYLGNKILQHGSVTVSHVTQSLLLGSVVLGFILSLSAFLIHYFIRIWINKKKDPQEGLSKRLK